MAQLKGRATGTIITVTDAEAEEILKHRALDFEVCDGSPVAEILAKVPSEVEHLTAKILKSVKSVKDETGIENGGSGKSDKAE